MLRRLPAAMPLPRRIAEPLLRSATPQALGRAVGFDMCRRWAPLAVGCGANQRGFAAAGTDISLLKTEMVDNVAVVTLLSPEGVFPWGTRIQEHRINRALITQLNAALDAAETDHVEALVVTGEGRFFCNGMDLQYISANIDQSTSIQTDAEKLLSRILTLPVPTVAALNGHWTAAGAMLGLAFDVRVAPSGGRGLFFVPGIDIGLVYSAGMTALMKAKLPQPMWTDVLCFGKRYGCDDLINHGVAMAAMSSDELLSGAISVAEGLQSKGKDEKTRQTLHGIKKNLYHEAVAVLGKDVEDMGFAQGTWDATGRPRKA